ncbi:class I lanthipeptide [Chitinophaga agrisoli]|uniref:class I lanthipeptide n=1 Tax=Chitinophaga agrisoli TaxID=2607653 RepID=UPI00166219DF
MKKFTHPKKLQLSKIKIASLSKSWQQALKGAGVCLTSLAQTTCPNCTPRETVFDCV